MILLAYLGLFPWTKALMPDESKMVMPALAASIAWHIGPVT
jgi:hypothetical protein